MSYLKRITGTPYQGAFHRLKPNADGQLLRKYFEESLADTDKALRASLDTEVMLRLQGKALTLQAILELLDAPVVQETKGQTIP